MFNYLYDAYVASTCNIPFKLAMLRARHIRNGHTVNNSSLIDTIQSHKHPKNIAGLVFTVYIYECNACGIIWHKDGLDIPI